MISGRLVLQRVIFPRSADASGTVDVTLFSDVSSGQPVLPFRAITGKGL